MYHQPINALGVPAMKQAIDAFHSITVSPEFREIERLYAKARHDEAQALHHERLEAEAATKRIIAKNCLQKSIPLDTIVEITGLSRDEVEKLRDSD
jgi:hypothetical protein